MQQATIPPGKTVIDLNSCHRNNHRSSHCNYCKDSKSNPGHADWGIVSNRMSVVDYQKLMDRGWRRCGGYYYKYDFENSCCQPYTIRLDTRAFSINHSQKKVMKRFNKFLCGEIDLQGNKVIEEEKKQGEHQQMQVDQTQAEDDKKAKEAAQRNGLKRVLKGVLSLLQLQDGIAEDKQKEMVDTTIISKSRDKALASTQTWSVNLLIKLLFHLKGYSLLPEGISNIKDMVEFLKTKQQELQKLAQGGEQVRIEESGYLTFVNLEKDTVPEKKPVQKQTQPKKSSLAEEEEKKGPKEEEKRPLLQEDLNYTQYFKEFSPLSEEQKKKGLKHKYTVQITRAICSKESFEVYQKYQAKIHNEVDKNRSGYSRFLCESPLFDPAEKEEAERNPTDGYNRDDSRETKDEGVWPEYLGSYHMIHRIDGEILAVGVLDNTPNVLSSVYLYYNPKFEFLQPGTFSAVREIEYCLRIQEVFKPDFNWYYMGLYFQDCQKSVYKASYKPSQVLCPVTYNYVDLTEEVKEKISQAKMPKLSMDKPKLKEMDLSNSQVQTLVKNFTFIMTARGVKLKIEDLSRSSVQQIQKVVGDLYLTLGLDVMLTSQFIV